jgi:uncharacterized protein (DUF1501 family)
MNKLNRRDFLKKSLSTAAGMSAFLSLATSIRSTHAANLGGQYKALVCVNLAGGNDAFNMFIPQSASEHSAYATVRQQLAIPRNQILEVTPSTYNDGAKYGFHPNMSGLHALFNQGKVATIANTGTLLRPISKSEYENELVETPPQLFSHNDQSDLWMLGHSNGVSAQGWAGKMMDVIYPSDSGPAPSPSISIAGNNLWQVGQFTQPYEIFSGGIEPLYFPWHPGPVKFEQAYKDIYNLGLSSTTTNPMIKTHAKLQKQQIQFSENIKSALTNAPNFTKPFGEGPLEKQLGMVAKLIAVRNNLDSNVLRQVFFVQLEGWDTHDAQNTNHPNLLKQLSQALDTFNAALVETGVSNQVTTFTSSEFGRSLTPNGDGTDHGWGGHSLVMGGAVKGNDIYGTMPDLSINSNDAVEEGRIIPTTSDDQYGPTLAKWFGLSTSEVDTLFPNLNRFNDRDLGFMKT